MKRTSSLYGPYVTAGVTPPGFVVKGNDGIYRTLTGRVVGSSRPCEHCEGERSPLVRLDAFRGLVCPPCDSALDEMLGETARGKNKPGLRRIDSQCPTCNADPGEPCWWLEFGCQLGAHHLHADRKPPRRDAGEL